MSSLYIKPGFKYNGVRYADVTHIQQSEVDTCLRHDVPVWKVGERFFEGNKKSIAVLAAEMVEVPVRVKQPA